MADIRNDQYLHRPGAGRGALTPADPLEVLLYDGSGNPLLVKKPTGETRQALGVAGYGYDGTNWRPVKVNASGQAEVQLTGSNVPAKLAPAAFETRVYNRSGSLAAGTREVIVDVSGRHCELEAVSVGSSFNNIQLEIYPYLSGGATGGYLLIPRKTGRGADPPSALVLQNECNGENDFFKNFLYDATNGYYVFGMKRQAVFGNGILMRIYNPDTSARDFSLAALIALWEA